MESMDNEDQLYDGWNSGTWANRIIWASTVFFFLAVLASCCGSRVLRWCTRASLIVVSGGYSIAVVHKLLIAVGSPGAEHRLQGTWTSVAVAHMFSCSTTRGIYVPGPGINPCPQLKGGSLATGPPGKSWHSLWVDFRSCHLDISMSMNLDCVIMSLNQLTLKRQSGLGPHDCPSLSVPIAPTYLYAIEFKDISGSLYRGSTATSWPALTPTFSTIFSFFENNTVAIEESVPDGIAKTSGISDHLPSSHWSHPAHANNCFQATEFLKEENTWTGVLSASKALMQLLVNPFMGPLTNRYLDECSTI